MSPSDQPAPAKERIDFLDVLRGFSLFGILLVNMRFFSFPVEFLEPKLYWSASIDQWTEAVILFFFNEKFYSLFSLLFGIGFGLQMKSLLLKYGSAWKTYTRRLLFLFCIGLLHGIFLWWGDVLAIYAFFGLFLIFFYPLPPRWIFIASLVCFIIPIIVSTVRLASSQPTGRSAASAPVISRTNENMQKILPPAAAQSSRIHASGSYKEIFLLRLDQLKINYVSWIVRSYGFQVFGMFLLGFYLVQARIIQGIHRSLPLLRKVWKITMGLSGLSLALFLFTRYTPVNQWTALELLSFEFEKINRTSLCLFYASSLILLLQTNRWKKRLLLVAPAGRIALTNYLFQTIICTLLFYGYGFRLYGTISPAVSLLFTAAIFTGQVLFSTMWMRYYQFGPFEWVWRSFTYRAIQPMRIHRSVH